MSGNNESMKLKEDDCVKFLVCQSHLGSQNVDFQMEQYVFKRKPDGIHIINLKKTWEKLLLAARAIAAIENPADVCVISARLTGQRAILKFAAHTGATAIAGRFTPGTFTNQIQKAFKEPRLLIVNDPRTDHQAITEASYVNIPVVALCNTDSPMKMVDVAIPCNNKSAKSIGLMWWMLAREVLIMRGSVPREMAIGSKFTLTDKHTQTHKEVMVDLYFYRDPEDQEKEQEVDKVKEPDQVQEPWGQEMNQAPIEPFQSTGIGFDLQPPQSMDWAAETQKAFDQQKSWQDSSAAGGGGGSNEWGGGNTNW